MISLSLSYFPQGEKGEYGQKVRRAKMCLITLLLVCNMLYLIGDELRILVFCNGLFVLHSVHQHNNVLSSNVFCSILQGERGRDMCRVVVMLSKQLSAVWRGGLMGGQFSCDH